MKLRRPIKNKGIARTLFILWIPAIWFVGYTTANNVTYQCDEWTAANCVITGLLYWPAIRLWLWVWDGFREKEKQSVKVEKPVTAPWN